MYLNEIVICIILFPDTLFGCELKNQFSPAETSAPAVIVKCVQEIEQRSRLTGMYTDVYVDHLIHGKPIIIDHHIMLY